MNDGVSPDDLVWLADRFVLGELDPDETSAAEVRLLEDDAFAAAVAQSSKLIAAVLATDPRATGVPTPRSRLRLVAAAIAVAVCVAIALVLMPSQQPGPQPADIVRFWRQAEVPDWPVAEANGDYEATDADIVPDWMLEAVALDTGDSKVLEN